MTRALGGLGSRLARTVALAAAVVVSAAASAPAPASAAPPTAASIASQRVPGAVRVRPVRGKRPVLRPARGHRRGAGRPVAGARVSIGGAPLPTRSPIADLRRRADVTLSLEEQTAARIEEVLRGPLRSGTTALYVVDASTGSELFSIHPDDPLNPASNVKLIATAAALDILGPEHRYETRLVGRTPGTDGTVDGDVYLLGSYDPTFGRADIDALVARLTAAGVRRVAGDVVVGATPTRDGMYRSRVGVAVTAGLPGQPVTAEVTPAYDFVTLDVKAVASKRRRPALRFREQMITDERGHARLKVTVEGTLPRGKSFTRWIAPRERALHTAHVLRAALTTAGIAIAGDARVAELPQYVAGAATAGWLPIELATHRSAPLSEIVARINKRSINWLADRVIMTAAAARFREPPSMTRALEVMYEWLEAQTGLTRREVKIDTGSGLSYRTELSARQIVKVLRTAGGLGAASSSDDLRVRQEAYLASLSVGGVDGTLRRRFLTAPLQGHLRGKTGTLRRVVALAGLLEPGIGRTLAFAVVSNGHPPAYKARVRAAHEKLVSILYDYLAASGAVSAASTPAAAAVNAATAAAAAIDDAVQTDDPDDEGDDEASADPTADAPTAP
jgi:serine-type D-Ala-D-Ala carboxypeptidase/endopeptidase (penicillin-binding protein 4)